MQSSQSHPKSQNTLSNKMIPATLTSLPYELLLIIAEKIVEDDLFPSYKTECTYKTSTQQLDRYWRISHQFGNSYPIEHGRMPYTPDNGAGLVSLAKAGNQRLLGACYEVLYKNPISGRGFLGFWDALECINPAYQNDIQHLKMFKTRSHGDRLEWDCMVRKGLSVYDDATYSDFAKTVSLKLQGLKSLDISCNSSYIIPVWIPMLSSLPSLKHLALRDCYQLEGDNFPHLPSLVEAHFYHCELPENEVFERMPSLKVLVIDNDYCLEDEDTEVCDVNPLADTVETCGWLVERPAHCYYYPLRQFRRVKHLKVNLIHEIFGGALEYNELPRYDGFPNLAATVETIEFASRITSRVTGGDPNAHARYYRYWQKSLEELRYTIDMMEECCRKEWRKVRLIDISMLALSYRRERSGYEGLKFLVRAKRRFQQELGIELLIS